MNPEDRKRAEEGAQKVVREWVEHDLDESLNSDYAATFELDSLVERIVAFAGEVRREQREWQQIDRDMAFYAFRYCLGRQTYAVNDCVNYLIANWWRLSHIERIRIQNEIEKHFKRTRRPVEDEWRRVLALSLDDGEKQ
jgi:hypothetical protein